MCKYEDSSTKFMLSAYYMPGTILGIENISYKGKILALKDLMNEIEAMHVLHIAVQCIPIMSPRNSRGIIANQSHRKYRQITCCYYLPKWYLKQSTNKPESSCCHPDSCSETSCWIFELVIRYS